MASAAAVAAGIAFCAQSINKILDDISANYFENEEVCCYWNDWEARDQRARIMRTYNNGRFSRQKTFWGIPNGRWYCVYKPKTLLSFGQKLD